MRTLLSLAFSMMLLHSCADPQQANLDKRLKTYRYPYKTQIFSFMSQTQRLEMAYMYETPEGKESSDKTAILLHGKNFSGSYWGQTAKELLEKNYNLLIPDQVGFGRSSKPLNYQYNLHQLADNTKKLIDWYKIDKVTLVGHSMGGMLAVRFALMYPQMVEKLILVNPIGLEDYQEFVPYLSIDTVFNQELKLTPEAVKDYQLKYYYDGKWRDEYDQWLRLQTGLIKGPDWQLVAYVNALTYDMIYTGPVVHELDRLQVKTHLIIGDRDTTALGKSLASEQGQAQLGQFKALGKKAQSRIKNSELTILEGIGHMPHIEDFSKFWKAFESALEN